MGWGNVHYCRATGKNANGKGPDKRGRLPDGFVGIILLLVRLLHVLCLAIARLKSLVFPDLLVLAFIIDVAFLLATVLMLHNSSLLLLVIFHLSLLNLRPLNLNLAPFLALILRPLNFGLFLALTGRTLNLFFLALVLRLVIGLFIFSCVIGRVNRFVGRFVGRLVDRLVLWLATRCVAFWGISLFIRLITIGLFTRLVIRLVVDFVISLAVSLIVAMVAFPWPCRNRHGRRHRNRGVQGKRLGPRDGINGVGDANEVPSDRVDDRRVTNNVALSVEGGDSTVSEDLVNRELGLEAVPGRLGKDIDRPIELARIVGHEL